MAYIVMDKCPRDCKYWRECNGFRDREGRCPEWVVEEKEPKVSAYVFPWERQQGGQGEFKPMA